MLLSKAIVLRIEELLKEQNLTVYKLSYRAGIILVNFYIMIRIFILIQNKGKV